MAKTANSNQGPQTPIGEAPAFHAMLAHVSQAATVDRPVLVIGERGTGKELVASRLAYLSPRWDRPFLKLNCAALSDQLLDSELFGHEAGAYTGAQRRRQSRFEMADGGTIFLDEIATASLAVQEKLLRVAEYGTFERVGGNETITVDVRLIGATNADLPALARTGRFRPDLLDRLSFDVINVPPLRARPEDILRLAEHFARRMTAELKRNYFAGFGPQAEAQLLAHEWPGNVRELRNAVERSVARMERPERRLEAVVIDPFGTPGWTRLAGTATVEEAPARQVAAAAPVGSPVASQAVPGETDGGFAERTRVFEARLLTEALEATRFNQKQAATRLGLTYYQFRHHLRVHNMLTGRRQAQAEAEA